MTCECFFFTFSGIVAEQQVPGAVNSCKATCVHYLREAAKKKPFIWEIFPKSVHPPQGFGEIWENER